MERKQQLGLTISVSVLITFVACVIMAFLFSGEKDKTPTILPSTTNIETLQDTIFSTLSGVADAIVSVGISKDIKLYVDDPSRVVAPGAMQTKEVHLGGASGIIIRKDGYVLTSKHVVADTQAKYQITLHDGSIYRVEKVWLDPMFDLAVLKVVNDAGIAPDDLPVAHFAGFNELAQIGQFVLSIGNVLNLYPNSVSFGIIAGRNKPFKIDDKHTYVGLYQTDAKIYVGNSGGPLINLQGKILGIMTSVADNQGIAFALPISTEFIGTLLSSIEMYQSIARPLIGIEYVDITPALKAEKKLSVDQGIFITAVLTGLPAMQAGIQNGDIVTAINEKQITPTHPFLYHMYMYLPGTTISLSVTRGEQTLTIPVTLGKNVQ